jgi:4a-hydroxytetrahydrobiopterin dehydratase
VRDLLSADDLRSELPTLDAWAGDTSSISRAVTIDSTRREQFLADLESVARELDHDPDLEVVDGNLRITMSTHSAGGVTELDIAYAHRVDTLVRALSDQPGSP